MYIGIDLGTSGVKVILLDEQGSVLASQTEKIDGLPSPSSLV
ncbi:Xylulose kinase [Kluyvera cryocrescens]|uniref:Xylulose kinase n=1 Tax=Kluyvera cryocrescens TaxID=580 RepID=A0A485AZ65_KLUCR|nr:Xylulose kinase [Kluyvera cryocrescens]